MSSSVAAAADVVVRLDQHSKAAAIGGELLSSERKVVVDGDDGSE